MPFKSKAQRRKFWAMAGRGEISRATVKRWEEHTPKRGLPERVKKKKKKGNPGNPGRKHRRRNTPKSERVVW